MDVRLRGSILWMPRQAASRQDVRAAGTRCVTVHLAHASIWYGAHRKCLGG